MMHRDMRSDLKYVTQSVQLKYASTTAIFFSSPMISANSPTCTVTHVLNEFPDLMVRSIAIQSHNHWLIPIVAKLVDNHYG